MGAGGALFIGDLGGNAIPGTARSGRLSWNHCTGCFSPLLIFTGSFFWMVLISTTICYYEQNTLNSHLLPSTYLLGGNFQYSRCTKKR
jgi:hypothetical protein